jgi:hypothetical protein
MNRQHARACHTDPGAPRRDRPLYGHSHTVHEALGRIGQIGNQLGRNHRARFQQQGYNS